MKKEEFDEIIRQNVIGTNGFDCSGYVVNNRAYPSHYNNIAYAAFVSQMMNDYPECYEKYNKGRGSELDGTPPKMASVASSSRFCYLALRNGAEALGGKGKVDFEHACPIQGIIGTPPQMDAYFSNNVFVEVKCHEIFDRHETKLSKQYFDYLFGQNNDFGLDPISKEEMQKHGIVEYKNEFEIPFEKMGLNTPKMLDFKQVICHLLGIKSHKNQEEKATFVYLFFKPKALTDAQQKEIDKIFDELKSEIHTIFNSSHIQNFVCKNNITLKAVAEYSEVISPLTTKNIITLY